MEPLNATDWLVIAAGIAGITWVNWYFFVANRGRANGHRNDAPNRGDVRTHVRDGHA